MYGIAGYRPAAATTVDQVLDAHGERLHALVGRRLVSATGLCFVGDGEWCSTRPLVLDFDGVRLELAVDGFDVAYLGWDSIDLGAPIDDPDQDDPDLALAWDDPRQAELDGLLGGVVRQVRVLEHEFRLDQIDGPRLRQWLLAGLELAFDGGRELQLWNEFSALRIAADSPGSDHWRRRIVGD